MPSAGKQTQIALTRCPQSAAVACCWAAGLVGDAILGRCSAAGWEIEHGWQGSHHAPSENIEFCAEPRQVLAVLCHRHV